jgi:hypothetical protein
MHAANATYGYDDSSVFRKTNIVSDQTGEQFINFCTLFVSTS